MNRKIGIGVLWNMANAITTRGASILFTIFLARLLAPEAFGMIAMATVVFELANVFVESGLGQALIRSKSVSQFDLSTVFFTNLGLSLVAYCVVYVTAPFVVDFYSQPELVLIIQVMGLVVLLNATKVVQVAVLSRKMDFKTQMKADSLGMVLSGMLAVTAAYQGFGVWSLIVQVLVSALISSVVLWLASSWRPSVQFSAESFSRLSRFGANLLLEGLLWRLMENSYVLVIGRFFSAEITGLYYFAKKISDLISLQLTTTVQRATFPALAVLQDDSAILRYKYRQIIQLMMFVIAPVMLMLAALASPLFRLLFDVRWQGAVPYLQLLCVVGVIFPLHAMNINILNVKGRSDLVLKVGLIKRLVNIALLFAALPFGVLAIAMSQIVGSLLALIPNAYYSKKMIGYGLKEQILDVIKPMLAALVAALGAWWVVQVELLSLYLMIPASCLIGLVIYIILGIITKVDGLLLLSKKIGRALWK
ncbi:MAG: lipopolysaccharide biosynthesis protein [Gammaproteobacteria bacterium]|nr:lipopolysaccharide biosynthesis protein [Gammaproteobacteria bacterium]MBU1446705.1 lipopolysaccharide biosynthesis protein [Gammaproteobacteria bacterium]